MQTLPERLENNLLSSLDAEDLTILKPHLEDWQADAGTVIHRPGEPLRDAFFPRGVSMISYCVVFGRKRSVDTMFVGREGAAGCIVTQGQLPAYTQAQVRTSGPFWRIRLSRLDEARRQSSNLESVFARYSECVLAQVFQSVACDSNHSIEQRAAKWLLTAIDRTGGTNLTLTQEQFASMLGIGRSYLSRVVHDLRKRGVLETRRNRIVVQKPDELRALACDCDTAVSRHFATLLKGVYANKGSSR